MDVLARKLPMQYRIAGTPLARLMDQAEVLERAIHELINEKRQEKETGKDVLSVLVEAAKIDGIEMNDTFLAAHAVILHAAAFITTASALAWTMYLIAQNPKFAAALHEEIKNNITDWPPTPETVEKLPFLDGLVRESLRLLPPVHHTMRTTTKETELLGVPLQTADRVVISAFMTHRDPAIFKNPTQFDPTRWFEGKPGPFQYIPFSAGPRLCLGYQFAMLEMKLVVIRIMQRFRMNVIPDSIIEADIRLTLRPVNGIPMVVNNPDGAFAASSVRGNINELVQTNSADEQGNHD